MVEERTRRRINAPNFKVFTAGFWIGFCSGAAVVAALLLAAPVAAQTIIPDPDALLIQSVRAYDGVLSEDDFLVVVVYTIDYDTLPSDTVNNTFIGRFLGPAGTEVNATEILAFNNLGYGTGVLSFYFTKEEKETASIEFNNPNSETYTAIVQGKPSAFPDPPKVTTVGIVYRGQGVSTEDILQTDVSNTATSLETEFEWRDNDLQLLDFIAGRGVLTEDGESYFGRVIPNLQVMIRDLFRSSSTAPFVDERDFTFSERDRLLDFWDGTPVETSINSLTSLFRVDAVLVSGLLGLAMVGFFVYLSNKFTQSPEYGILTVAFVWPLTAAMGLTTMTAIMIATAIGVLGLGFAFVLRRA